MARAWDSYKLEEALKLANESNPELKRLDNVLIASEHGIDYQRADFLPSLSLNINYGIERTQFINQNFEGWQGGLNLKWKIFDSLKTISRVEQAQAEFIDARLALNKAKLDTDIEVRRSISSVSEARELVDVSSKVIKQAEESFRLSQNRFDVGSATQLDVLAERLALTEARSNNAQALYSQNMAEAELRRVMGTLGSDFIKE
jgi:outer membrane protein TolC